MSAFLSGLAGVGADVGQGLLLKHAEDRQAQQDQLVKQESLARIQAAQQSGQIAIKNLELRRQLGQLTQQYRLAQSKALADYRAGQLSIQGLRAQLAALQAKGAEALRAAVAQYNAARLKETARHDKAMELIGRDKGATNLVAPGQLDALGTEVSNGTVKLSEVPVKNRGTLLSRMAAQGLAPMPKIQANDVKAVDAARNVIEILSAEKPLIKQIAADPRKANGIFDLLRDRGQAALYALGMSPEGVSGNAEEALANLHGMATITLTGLVSGGRMNRVMLDWLDKHTPKASDTPSLMWGKQVIASWLSQAFLQGLAKRYSLRINNDGSMNGVVPAKAGYEGYDPQSLGAALQMAQRMGVPGVTPQAAAAAMGTGAGGAATDRTGAWAQTLSAARKVKR